MCIWFSSKKEVTEKCGKSKESKGLRNTWPLTNLVCSNFLKLILCQCLAHCIPPIPHNISHVKALNFAIFCILKPFFLSDVSDEITSRLHSLTISGTIFALCPKIATNHTELAKYGTLQYLNWRFDSDIPFPLSVSISKHLFPVFSITAPLAEQECATLLIVITRWRFQQCIPTYCNDNSQGLFQESERSK